MIRFSCFNSHAHSTKSKKATGPSVEAMEKNLLESSNMPATKAPAKTSCLSSSIFEAQANAQVSGNVKDVKISISVERCWNSDEIKGEFSVMSYTSMHRTAVLKKSQSLGSGLCHQGQSLSDEDGTDQGDSGDSLDHSVLKPDSSKDQEMSPRNQQQRAPQSVSVNVCSDLVNNESIFSVGDPQHSEEGSTENSETMLSAKRAHQSDNHMAPFNHTMVKSCSLPQIGPSNFSSSKHLSHSRSCEDLHILDMRRKDALNNEVQTKVVLEEVEDDNMYKHEINNYQNSVNDGYDCCDYSASAKGWVIPEMDEMNLENRLHVQSPIEQHSDDRASRDFRLKRIEDWVHDLQHCSSLEETSKFLGIDDPPKSSSSAQNDGLSAAKADEKSTPGMEAAKRYISSLSASATTAQLANHGLVVIPLFSAFVGLKVLNLSGNSIVRITAGALPKGLHALNLSKNNISVIEGLRELTRLRILDLSYNRILRIGHGLASCSCLKELYLAGNKISEVEGLHRLLKLSVLDLRFNKISTSKCLGQLAANYNSLQAISLEGNPVQKNVGNDQLKKHLLGLLPRLVYINQQPIKASTLKDTADRAVRLGMNAHQFDRGLWSDSKALWKTTRGASGLRASSSSTHGRKSPAVVSPKRSRPRHVRLPPSGNKAPANHHHNYFDLGRNFRSELSIRKSRSEGNLGAL